VNLLSKILSCERMNWCEWDRSLFLLLLLFDRISIILNLDSHAESDIVGVEQHGNDFSGGSVRDEVRV